MLRGPSEHSSVDNALFKKIPHLSFCAGHDKDRKLQGFYTQQPNDF